MSSLINDFDENGFCIVRNAISSSLVEEANRAVDRFRMANDQLLRDNDLLVEGMLQRVVNFHYSVPCLKDVFVDAMSAADSVVDKYGVATLYTSLFFELGSQQSLHRDTPYFYSGANGGYMGAWVALDDVDATNGVLIAVKGSHNLPEPDLVALKNEFFPDSDVPPSSTPLFNAYNDALIDAANKAGLPVVECIVKKGDLVIWNPATLHGGLPHIDKSKTRRSFVMHITPKNMPMRHMDYFFHRDRPIGGPDMKIYFNHRGRDIVAGSEVDFRHVKKFSIEKLGVF